MYIPVVNTESIYPVSCEKTRDFIYLAANYKARGTTLFSMPCAIVITAISIPSKVGTDLTDARITTSTFNEKNVVELLRTSKIAVYPADHASSPA